MPEGPLMEATTDGEVRCPLASCFLRGMGGEKKQMVKGVQFERRLFNLFEDGRLFLFLLTLLIFVLRPR
ncbi:hypothetical protein LENED_000698 [Lentinula edodes]|uniref:Uncharacterized protein n=1 Tax=Lentinula edodes TaxID=5353 RepID=A0A1Q3DWG6_LENED|nr:hypothetical protein LENED_000698 [Lentinula edodes]